MTKIKMLKSHKHRGERFGAGDVLDVSDAVADRLKVRKKAVDAPDNATPANKKKAPKKAAAKKAVDAPAAEGKSAEGKADESGAGNG
ncbi:MAG: hypothetical protein RJP96_02775 [Algiphilus sp.]|uniref:DUF7210 family protein n=1 Tax=Algiphilus sp. TaxID=1872431 RepID=UPI0032F03E24